MTTYNQMLETMPEAAGPLTFPLAVTAGGNAKYFNLQAAPHALVAGVTGSGKSVVLNVAIATMIQRAEGRLTFDMIDPKRVELSIYRNVDCVRSVTTDMDQAAQVVASLVEEMDQRYQLLERAGVRKLDDYNEVTGESLPVRVLVVDELADLMDTHKAQVLPALVRIGQLGRAAGFHMLLATQRPAADTIPKKLLSNVPARIGLTTQSHTESRLILGEKGAEDLNGHGDMLTQIPGEKGLTRGQGPFLSDEEIAEIVLAHTAEDFDPSDEYLDATEEEDEWDPSEEAEEEGAEDGHAGVDVDAVQALSRLLTEMAPRNAGIDPDLHDRIVRLERENAELRTENAGLAELTEELQAKIDAAEERTSQVELERDVAQAQAQSERERADELIGRADDIKGCWAEERQERKRAAVKMSTTAALCIILVAVLAPIFAPAGVVVALLGLGAIGVMGANAGMPTLGSMRTEDQWKTKGRSC